MYYITHATKENTVRAANIVLVNFFFLIQERTFYRQARESVFYAFCFIYYFINLLFYIHKQSNKLILSHTYTVIL